MTVQVFPSSEGPLRFTLDEDNAAPVLLTSFDVDEYVYGALRAGASGFLLKDVSPEQLVAAVRLVAAGDALLAPSIVRRFVERFATPARPPKGSVEADLSSLTAREREVARILSKLGLRDRVQAVVIAYEAGVVVPGEQS